jgi:hypothetical protein
MSGAAQTLTIRVPLTVRQRGGRKVVVMPDAATAWAPQQGRPDNTLVKAIARAFRWQRMLETGRYSTIMELAAAEKINVSYVSRVLRLSLLAPDLVDAILDGRQPATLTLPRLMKPLNPEWAAQRIRLSADC